MLLGEEKKEGHPSKRRYFSAISLSSMLQLGTDMLVMTSFLGVSTSMTLNDLEPPK